MGEKSTIWEMTPHTAAKHQLLAGYLDAWYPILAKYNKRVVFIDGFAGPGVYRHGEDGSPILALRQLLAHRHLTAMSGTTFVFVFNEQDPARFESLSTQLAAFRSSVKHWPSNIVVRLENRNFRELAEGLLTELNGGLPMPAFAFLDPFGYRDVPMELVKRLGAHRMNEAFIYFDFNSTNRFSNAGVVDEHFSTLFGSEEYKEAPSGEDGRKQFLHDLYARQLREVAGYPLVQSFEMVNASGHTGNYLFFCTRDRQAFDRMKSVMWKVDPLGAYRFSDILAGREVLFQLEVDTGPLRAALLQHFAGQTVSIQDVTNYVIEKTPYTSGHLKLRTLKPMQQDGAIECPEQKRTGQFPDGTYIRFPAAP